MLLLKLLLLVITSHIFIIIQSLYIRLFKFFFLFLSLTLHTLGIHWKDPTDPPPPKPVRLLDLWANRSTAILRKSELARWLDAAEKEGIEMVDGIPKTALIYVTWNILSPFIRSI